MYLPRIEHLPELLVTPARYGKVAVEAVVETESGFPQDFPWRPRGTGEMGWEIPGNIELGSE